MLVSIFNKPDSPPLSTRKVNLKKIAEAMAVYHQANGVLSVSDRGSEAALYLLKDLIPADRFTLPGRAVDAGPARYDDDTQQVVNCGYRYLNRPCQLTFGAAEGAREPLCIMLEPFDDAGAGVYVLFSDGHVAFVPLPVGTTPEDILGAGSSSVLR